MIIEPDSFDFLVDVSSRDEVIIGLHINATDGQEFTVPIPLSAAQDVGSVLLGHVAALHAVTGVTAPGSRIGA